METVTSRGTWMATLTYRGDIAPGYEEVQKWLKRLRKAGHGLRYMAVVEHGARKGRLHYHLLIHEVENPIPKSALEAAGWHRRAGFAKFVRIRTAGASSRYVAKYLAKSGGKPRASSSYGTKWVKQYLPKLMECFPGSRIKRVGLTGLKCGGTIVFPRVTRNVLKKPAPQLPSLVGDEYDLWQAYLRGEISPTRYCGRLEAPAD